MFLGRFLQLCYDSIRVSVGRFNLRFNPNLNERHVDPIISISIAPKMIRICEDGEV